MFAGSSAHPAIVVSHVVTIAAAAFDSLDEVAPRRDEGRLLFGEPTGPFAVARRASEELCAEQADVVAVSAVAGDAGHPHVIAGAIALVGTVGAFFGEVWLPALRAARAAGPTAIERDIVAIPAIAVDAEDGLLIRADQRRILLGCVSGP